MMKFLKTIRFDPSDSQVFKTAADPDEWAIPGGFRFANAVEDELAGKEKQAFSNGFLSLTSFGFSTFVSVAEISGEEKDDITARLVQHFIDHYGAPSPDAAGPAAQQEIAFVLDLCEQVPINSVFTLRRIFDDNAAIKEEFRIVDVPSETRHARVWDVVEE